MSIQKILDHLNRPSVMLRPAILKEDIWEGDSVRFRYRAIYDFVDEQGKRTDDGVEGEGDTIEEALRDFDENIQCYWVKNIDPVAAR